MENGGELCHLSGSGKYNSDLLSTGTFCFILTIYQRKLLHDNLYFLTHLPLDKMTAILVDDIFKYIFLHENDTIPIQMSLKLVSRGPIGNKPALVQVLACRPFGARTNDLPVNWRIYAALRGGGVKGLKYCCLMTFKTTPSTPATSFEPWLSVTIIHTRPTT